MIWKQTTAALAGLLWFAPAPSFAAPVTISLMFSGTGFVDEYGTPAAAAPFSSIAGDFSVTFDPTLQYESQTSGLIVRSLTGVPVSSPIAFSYFPSDHELYLGGSLNSPESAASGTNDVLVAFNVSDPFRPSFVNCTDPDNDCVKAQGNASVLVTDYTNVNFPDSGFFLLAAGAQVTVAEPPAIGLLLAGLATVGMARLFGSRSGQSSKGS